MSEQKKPPKYLSAAGKKWFRQTAIDYPFESAAEWALLEQAAATLDRIEQCRERIDTEGLTVPTGGGGCKPHPCVNLERDCRILYARLCRELRLADPVDEDETRLPRK